MPIKATQSLDGLVKEAIENAIQSDSLRGKVQQAADKAISEAIEQAFGYSSEFRRGITESVKSILPIVSAQELSVFAHATREVIQRRLANLASETSKAYMDKVLKDILPEEPVIDIKDLKEEYLSKLINDASMEDCSCHDASEQMEFGWNIEQSANSEGYWDLWMNPDPDANRYDKNSVALRFKKSDQEGLHQCWMVSLGTNHHEVNIKSLFSGPLYGFDAMLFRLATGTALLKK